MTFIETTVTSQIRVLRLLENLSGQFGLIARPGDAAIPLKAQQVTADRYKTNDGRKII
jgi:hypothetical protein